MPGPSSDDLERLRRWEGAGGSWRVVGGAGQSLTVSLCRCDGGEEVERFSSDAADLRAHLGSRRSSED